MGGYGFYARVVDRDSSLVVSADQQLMPVSVKIKKKKK